MTRIRVLIADDHALVRSGLSLLIGKQPDLEVVGEASDGEEAIRKCLELTPDVLLLDITMPGMSGIEVLQQAREQNLPVTILVLTMHEEERLVIETLKAGALGYVPKGAADSELATAIRTVHSGEPYVHSSLVRSVVREFVHRGAESPPPAAEADDGLSRREAEVLVYIARGYANREIAGSLSLSVKTVETYKARMMEKLGLRSRVELVRYAMQRGLLAEDTPGTGDQG